VNWSAEEVAEMPPGVVMVMSTVPAVPAGLVALIWLAELTVKLEAALLPKSTAVAPLRLVPVMVTTVPPMLVPEVGLMPLTTGAGVVV
jgi:hypothetical protein